MKSIFSQRPVRRRPINHLLRFESLKQRLALATHVWTGAVSSLWSNSGNWSGGSPAGDAQAVLAFPSAANVVNNNDLVGLKVAAIDFAAGNYVLSGNPITLVQGPQGVPRLHMDAAAKNNMIAIDLGRAATNIGINVDIASGSTLTVTGVISGGDAATNITKEGPGKLILSAANTFADSLLVNAGVLSTANSSALGTAEGGTTVANTSRLELQGPLTIAAERLVLVRSTLGNLSGNNVWQGQITLVGSSVFDTSSDSVLDTLTILGPIGGSGGLTVPRDTTGKLILAGANTFTGPVTVEGILNIRNPLALGPAIGSSVSVGIAATLELELTGTNSFNHSLSLTGGGGAALRNLGGDNTWAGPVRLIDVSSTIDVNAGQLNISGAISQTVGARPVGIVKIGDGSLFLSGICTYEGSTSIFAGALFVNGSLASRVVQYDGRVGGTGSALTISNGGGVISPGLSAGRLTTTGATITNGYFNGAYFTSNADFEVDLNGTTAGASYDQLRVVAPPAFDAPTLIVHLNFFPSLGTSFRIVDNTGSFAVLGKFANLPEGAIISTAFGNLRISYVGGDGNDVVLTVVYSLIVVTNTPSRFPDRSVTAVIDEGGVATLTGTISDPDLHDVFFLDVNWGDGTPTEKHVFPPGSNGQQVQLTHRYLDDDPTGTPQDDYHIQLVWHDKAGEGSSATMTTTVRNVAPVVNAVPDVQLAPSGLLHQLVTFTDPGRDKWTATVDFGDGGGPQPVDVLGGKQLLLHHRYQQPGTYLVRVTVTDDDDGVGRTSFRVRLAGQLEPSRVDAFYGWFDDYQQENKPRRPSLR